MAEVRRVADTRLPTDHGDFRCLGYETGDGFEYVVLIRGEPSVDADGALVRVHSECLTGDVLGSRRCDCGAQLDASLRLIAEAGSGVVVYLRGHEGRGIGLLEKLRAYELQDAGFDTVDANLRLGHPVDGRDYAAAAAVLADLGVRSVRLLTNNPRKREAISSHGVRVVATEPLVVEPGADNARYLATKRDRLGHLMPAESAR